MKNRLFLQFFADEGEGNEQKPNSSAKAGEANGGHEQPGYTYDQLEQIASSRADRASRTALADFFRRQGMSEDEITTAINDYKAKKLANQPNIPKIEKERDDAIKELETYKNNDILRKKGVREEDLDYVFFKVSKLVTDKLPFDKAADQFLKENVRFTSNSYRVVSGSESGSGNGNSSGTNESINDAIRRAARR